MATSPSWTLGRTLLSNSPNQLTNIFMETSQGYSNYNALFFSLTARDFHGLTAISNFTWSRSLGTGDVAQATSELSVPNPFNISQSYGPQLVRLSLRLQPQYALPDSLHEDAEGYRWPPARRLVHRPALHGTKRCAS